MKKVNIIIMIILFFILSISVGFSAFVSELSIGNVGVVRVKKDVRITDVSLANELSSGVIPNRLNYSVNNVLANVTFNNMNSYVTYKVTVTNIESAEIALFEVSGLPSSIDYEIIDYKLKDKLCDENARCNLGARKTFSIKIYPKSTAGIGVFDLNLYFDFREIYSITYEGISNSGYPTEVIAGDDLTVSFFDDIPESLIIYSNNVRVDLSDYTYLNNTLKYNDISGDLIIKSAKNLFNIIGLKTNGVDTGIDFSNGGISTNGKGVNTLSGTENDSYPVYYYRGVVNDNNVLFANFCWKIVRTTGTGGIKLIYNGVPAADGSCNNTGTASQIGTGGFYSSRDSSAYVGYMYGTVYKIKEKLLSDLTGTYVFGNDFVWNGSSYSLNEIENNTMISSNWEADYKSIASRYHYTCFNSTGVCNEIYYISYFGKTASTTGAYYLTLENGKDIEDVKNEMFMNITDSHIKTKIDSWYFSNMTGYTNMLEDTVWCNDRNIMGGSLSSKDTDGVGASTFAAYYRNTKDFVPSLMCSNLLDSFTVGSGIGNGKLIYPVGLLTADEFTLAGSGSSGYRPNAYLNTGVDQWTLSPMSSSNNVFSFSLYGENGNLSSAYVEDLRGIRPSVSLKIGAGVVAGDGTSTNPYIVG